MKITPGGGREQAEIKTSSTKQNKGCWPGQWRHRGDLK